MGTCQSRKSMYIPNTSSIVYHRPDVGLMPTLFCYQMKELVAQFQNKIASVTPLQTNKVQIKFKDGSHYEGEIAKQGQMNGKGKLVMKNKIQFQGIFQNNYPVKGTIQNEHFKYVGPLEDFRPDGQGEIVFQKGGKYTGQFKKGKREGKGIYRKGKLKIKGYWQNDELTGPGQVIIRGTYEFRGNFKRFRREGYGEQSKNGILEYRGEYKNNIRQGFGIFQVYGQQKTMGNWKNDKLDGKAMVTDLGNNLSQSGVWMNDKFVQKCVVDLQDLESQLLRRSSDIDIAFTTVGSSIEDSDDEEIRERQDKIQLLGKML